MSWQRSVLGLVVCVVLCYGAAAIGAIFTTSAIPDWYSRIEKPPWTPPNWLFGPVWTMLYLTIAVAAWMVWSRERLTGNSVPLILFALQLVLNAAWSPIFFGLHMLGAALFEIVALWTLALATTVAFWRVTPMAGALMLPYLSWLAFALSLNFAIWRMNA